MTPINWPRALLSAGAWCVAYNLLTGATWFAFLDRVGIPSFHPLLGASQPPGSGHVISLLSLTLAMGLFAMWFYAVIRPRYAEGWRTSVCVGIVLWLAWGLMPNWPLSGNSSLPTGPLLAELISKLAVLIVATAAGAALYREPAAHDLSVSTS